MDKRTAKRLVNMWASGVIRYEQAFLLEGDTEADDKRILAAKIDLADELEARAGLLDERLGRMARGGSEYDL